MNVQWESDLVEKPFCEQLKVMGWQWLEGDTDVPKLTERASFREVLLKARQAVALRRLNLRDGQPWLDDNRIARAIRDLEQMVFLVRKMRMTPRLNRFKVVAVTDRTDLEGQLREMARLSGETLRPNERDTARRESPTARTQRILQEPTPDIVFAMLQKYQDVAQRGMADRVAVTMVRRERKPGKDAPVVEREITFEESIRFEEFPVLNESSDILILVDEAHRSHTRTLHRNLRRAPQCRDHRLHRHTDPEPGEGRDARDLRRLHRQVRPARGGAGRRHGADPL
ncbi:MAG TPA: hypothetical protein VNP04_19200 [Alphaproteobacteria bacterium]|nr:hypothetical protein [Alphaproteobacteria bacterium]